MQRIRQSSAVLVAIAIVVSLVAMATVFGITGAKHPDDAPDMTDEADFTTNFPHTTDYYPGDVNEENGSIEYFASGADAFAEQDAEEGVWIDYIIIHAAYEGEDWIDYSACSTDNTRAFGIDRGNDNEGTQTDEDLVSKQKSNQFRDDGIVVNIFSHDDFAGEPAYMAPEDAIVAAQGAGSAAGACLTLTEEPGWYRIAGFMNGTVADNGPDEPPSEDADRVSLELNANFMYVCECEDGQEAREQLGPPPNESGSTPTPTAADPGDDPTPTPTAADPGGDSTPTPTAADPGDDPTPTPTAANPGGNGDGGDGGGNADGGNTDGGDGGGGQQTPTLQDGPGFTAVVALLALLASALLVRRRS